MSNTFYFILTKAGIAKLVNAQMTQSKVEYSFVAFGDGNGNYYEPSNEVTALKKEVYRAPISIVEHVKDEGGNPTNRVRIESVIPASVGNFTIREIGLIDSDGDLVGIGKYPATYKPSTEQGAAKDLIVRIIVETTNSESVTLKVDPSIAIASRQYVDEKVSTIVMDVIQIEQSIADLQTDFTTHLDDDASITKKGHVQLSNSVTSADEAKAATSKAVKTAMDRADSAFTQANDIKGKWANVVGSPLVSNDTQAQLQSKTQTIKNTLAANLTRKGTIASGTETLTELVNKVDNIKKKLSTELDTHQTSVPYSVNDDYIWLQDSVSVTGGSTWQWSKYRRENDILIKRYDGAESVCCFGEIKLINNYIQIFDESTGVLLKSFPKGGIDLWNYTLFFITEDKKFFLIKLKSGGRDIIKYTDTGLVVNSVQTRDSSPSLATSDKNLIINRSGKEFFRVDDLIAQAININQDLATVMTVHNDYQ